MKNDIIIKISECIEKINKNNQEIAKKFRSRAREMPADIFSRGFAYTLTFIAAKSSASSVQKGLEKSECDSLISEILNDNKLDKDEKGYALYGALLLYALKEMGVINTRTFQDTLKSVLNNPFIDVRVSEASRWIKRFSEAYIEAEG